MKVKFLIGPEGTAVNVFKIWQSFNWKYTYILHSVDVRTTTIGKWYFREHQLDNPHVKNCIAFIRRYERWL